MSITFGGLCAWIQWSIFFHRVISSVVFEQISIPMLLLNCGDWRKQKRFFPYAVFAFLQNRKWKKKWWNKQRQLYWNVNWLHWLNQPGQWSQVVKLREFSSIQIISQPMWAKPSIAFMNNKRIWRLIDHLVTYAEIETLFKAAVFIVRKLNVATSRIIFFESQYSHLFMTQVQCVEIVQYHNYFH